MYKTKLQEMCHRRRWGLLKYAYMKDGPDHSPSFKAFVSVNGMSFDSSPSCKSSKEALNDAAKLTFLHFDSQTAATTEGRPASESTNGGQKITETLEENVHRRKILDEGNVSSISSVELDIGGGGGLKKEETYQRTDTGSQTVQVMDGKTSTVSTRQGCKIMQFKNLDAPSYCTKCEGPSHKPVFKATVAVGGHTFESPSFFKTLKGAEHAAAKAALMSLYYDGIYEVDSGFYRILLQELTQKESLSRPIYKTTKSGASHQPTFFSGVEVEEKLFYGKAGKSQKEVEAKAAEVACTILKEDQVQEVISGEDNMVRNKDSPSCSKSVSQASSEGLLSSATPANPDILPLPYLTQIYRRPLGSEVIYCTTGLGSIQASQILHLPRG